MKIFDEVTIFHNWLSDKDFIWWPFSFLRPEPKILMTIQLTSLMTLCFAGLSFVMYACFAVVNNALDLSSLFQTFIMFFGGFFVWFNLVTKPLWNRRARQLQQQ